MDEGKAPQSNENLPESEQKAWILHFVSNWLTKAIFKISMAKSAEDTRQDLIAKLSSKGRGEIMQEALKLIQKSDWSTSQGLKVFRTQYLEFEKAHDIKQ